MVDFIVTLLTAWILGQILCTIGVYVKRSDSREWWVNRSSSVEERLGVLALVSMACPLLLVVKAVVWVVRRVLTSKIWGRLVERRAVRRFMQLGPYRDELSKWW